MNPIFTRVKKSFLNQKQTYVACICTILFPPSECIEIGETEMGKEYRNLHVCICMYEFRYMYLTQVLFGLEQVD